MLTPISGACSVLARSKRPCSSGRDCRLVAGTRRVIKKSGSRAGPTLKGAHETHEPYETETEL